MTHPWDELLSDVEKEVIGRAGYGNRNNLGKRPALLIIDAQYNFYGSREPILEQLEEYPTGVGIEAWKSVDSSRSLLAKFRKLGFPVIYTRYIAQPGGSSHESKMRRDHSKYAPDSKGSEIIDELKPESGEMIIDKNYASAFFGTPLINYLVGLTVDTVIIIGGTTSGCVRSTAVDSANYGFRTAVISDCVFDRISAAHRVALMDIWMKYGTVVSSAEALSYISSLQ